MYINPKELSFNELVKALKDSDSTNRRIAATALGARRTKRAVTPLIGTLKDSDPAVRRAAAVSLGLLQDPHAIEPLLKALKDWNPQVRNQAASALAMIHDPRAIDAMIFTLIRDPDANVRSLAILALNMSDYTGDELVTDELHIEEHSGYGRLGDAFETYLKHTSIRDLVRILEDPNLDAYIRSRAAFGLGLICDREAMEPLREASKSELAALSSQAKAAVDRINRRYTSGKEPTFSLRQVLGTDLLDDGRLDFSGREPARAVMRVGMNFFRNLKRRFSRQPEPESKP